MEQVTFVIEHKKDKNLLIAIAEKLGIKKYAITKTKKTIPEDKWKDLFKTIDNGADVSNFGDPSLWQRKTRKDRTLNQFPK
ncbi:MAG: hypothetical protein ACRDE5_05155 [Ginsengibacter sp.]